MNVTVTRLTDGFVLGVRCSHACLDGTGFYTMVNQWSRAARGEAIELPLIDQSVIPAPSDRPPKMLKDEATTRGWHPLTFDRDARIVSSYPRHLQTPRLRRTNRRNRARRAPNDFVNALPAAVFTRKKDHRTLLELLDGISDDEAQRA